MSSSTRPFIHHLMLSYNRGPPHYIMPRTTQPLLYYIMSSNTKLFIHTQWQAVQLMLLLCQATSSLHNIKQEDNKLLHYAIPSYPKQIQDIIPTNIHQCFHHTMPSNIQWLLHYTMLSNTSDFFTTLCKVSLGYLFTTTCQSTTGNFLSACEAT